MFLGLIRFTASTAMLAKLHNRALVERVKIHTHPSNQEEKLLVDWEVVGLKLHLYNPNSHLAAHLQLPIFGQTEKHPQKTDLTHKWFLLFMAEASCAKGKMADPCASHMVQWLQC